MHLPTSRTLVLAAIALAICAVTQIAYVALQASGTPLATALWRTEAVAFLALALAGCALAGRLPVIGAGLAAGGLLNVAQVGIGLTLFEPLAANFPMAFEGVLAFAFFLYFAGKAAFGVAGMAIGWHMWANLTGMKRLVGAAAGLSAIAAFAVNLLAMMIGMDLVFPAGATGTLAAVLLAGALVLARNPLAE